MDPRIAQLITQQQQGGGQGPQPQAAQQAPQGGPQKGQNPFLHLVQGGLQSPGGAGQPQQEQPMTPEMAKAMGMDPTQMQTMKGSNPGGSKFLLGAMQQLQGYVAQSANRDEIAIARSIMQLLVRLIDQDQSSQQDSLNQEGQAPQGAPQPGAGQGQPTPPQGQPQ